MPAAIDLPEVRVIRAITLDLDDTLWPIEPVILGAEAALDEWLREHCPEVAAAWPVDALRALRDRVSQDNPQLGHDFATLRKLSLAEAFAPFDRGNDWVERAFEVFHAARHKVDLYPEALSALSRLAERYPLASVSNGTADLHRVGLSQFFVAQVSARVVGAAKPDARIFHKAAGHLGTPPHEIAHVGDDPQLDVIGAQRAGMVGVWLNRQDAAWPHDERPDLEIRSLDQLETALGAYIAQREPIKEPTA